MEILIGWLEAHDKLAGWAQFFGAMLALIVMYFTAFSPVWRRKRQLENSAARLLSHGYEVIESYYRTSQYFLPFPLSLRQAASSMMAVVGEMNRFPIFELDDQGSRSVARHIVAISGMLSGMQLFLEAMATELDEREATKEDQKNIRDLLAQQLELVQGMLSGKELKRPSPADFAKQP